MNCIYNKFILFFVLTLTSSLSIAQTNFGDHLDNPVWRPEELGRWDYDGIWLPLVIHDGSEYKMWYSGFDGTNIRVGLATSYDGLNWQSYQDNPVIDIGANGQWDDDEVKSGPVIFDGLQYKMWYTGDNGTISNIGLATSEDGITWHKYESNPVMTIGEKDSWDDNGVIAGSVLYDEFQYKMWYTGDDGEHQRVGYATSSDGIVWLKHENNPVMDVGEPEAWDEKDISHAYVIFNQDMYQMWYEVQTWLEIEGLKTGYATSTDGIQWTRYPDNPVAREEVGSVRFENSVYRMWSCDPANGFYYYEDFSNIAHADSFTINSHFVAPDVDKLKIKAWIGNPQNHDISVRAIIENVDSLFVDSLDLQPSGDNQRQGQYIPSAERICNIWIKTVDNETGSEHIGNMWQIEKFCSQGPVKIFIIAGEDTIANPGDELSLKIVLQNQGAHETIRNISMDRPVVLDTFSTIIGVRFPEYGDIEPGAIAEPSRSIILQINENSPHGIYTQIKFDFRTGEDIFWSDTLTFLVTGLENTVKSHPMKFALGQNYPNPFNPKTMINYQLAMTSDVELAIYNLLGQKVATLVNKKQTAGSYQVQWDASNFSSSVYLYRLSAGDFTEVRKMVLMK